MRFDFIKMIATALIAVAAPVALQAQMPGAFDPNQLPPEVQQAIMELQQIQAQLQPIQEQVLADPEIQAEQAALGEEIQTAMTQADPSVPQHMARLQELAGDAEAAQTSQDEGRMNEILQEAQGLEMQLQQAQQQALQRPELAPRIDAFQQKVESRMLAVNPEAGALMERMGELQTQLMSMMVPQ